MSSIKFKHEGTEYEADLTLLEERGLVKKIHPKIIHINVGDVFISPNKRYGNVLVIQTAYGDSYNLAGCVGLETYSNEFYTHASHTKEEVIGYLNKREMVFLKNINSEITRLVG